MSLWYCFNVQTLLLDMSSESIKNERTIKLFTSLAVRFTLESLGTFTEVGANCVLTELGACPRDLATLVNVCGEKTGTLIICLYQQNLYRLVTEKQTDQVSVLYCRRQVLYCKRQVLYCKRQVLYCKRQVLYCKRQVLYCKRQVLYCKRQVLYCKRQVLYCKRQVLYFKTVVL